MVLSWFASKVSPIAIDIGTETIKLLQVEPRENGHRLVAAACEVIPDEIRLKGAAERENFVQEALRKMINEGLVSSPAPAFSSISAEISDIGG